MTIVSTSTPTWMPLTIWATVIPRRDVRVSRGASPTSFRAFVDAGRRVVRVAQLFEFEFEQGCSGTAEFRSSRLLRLLRLLRLTGLPGRDRGAAPMFMDTAVAGWMGPRVQAPSFRVDLPGIFFLGSGWTAVSDDMQPFMPLTHWPPPLAVMLVLRTSVRQKNCTDRSAPPPMTPA